MLLSLFLIFFFLHISSSEVDRRCVNDSAIHAPLNRFNKTTPLPVPTHVPFNGQCDKLGHTYEDGVCIDWDVNFMVVLRPITNHTHAQRLLESIKNFAMKISDSCDIASTMKIYTPVQPANSCPFLKLGTPYVRKFLDIALTLNNTVLPRDFQHSDDSTPIHRMFHEQCQCTEHDPARGRAIFFLTNLRCNNGCDESTQAILEFVNAQIDIVETMRSNGTILKVIYLDRGDDELDCNVKTILWYVAKLEQVIIASETVGSLDGYAESLSTCPPKKVIEQKKTMNAMTLDILIIGVSIPLAASLIILASCLYLAKKRRMMRKSLIEEFRDQQTKRMNDCKELFVHKISTVEQTFEKLSELAKQCSVDLEYEVCSSDLLLEASSVVGCGAFGKVHRGFLKSSALPGTSVRAKDDPHVQWLPSTPTSLHKQASFELGGEPGFQVAVKRLSAYASDDDRLAAFNEMRKLKALQQHANVVGLIATISSPSDPVIILEYCEHGDLLGLVRRHAGDRHDRTSCALPPHCLTSKLLYSLCIQTAEAMIYLHSKNILHRDLAARNILVTDQMTVKVSEFGLSRYLDECMSVTRICHKWSAPEVLKERSFSKKSDVYSFGVVLFDVFSGGLAPFPSSQPDAAGLERGERPRLGEEVDGRIRSLLSSCLSHSPSDRPSFVSIRSALNPLLDVCDSYLGYIDMESRASVSYV